MKNLLFKKRKPDTHKGDYGHLFIMGGSPGLTGAVCLAGLSALRSGCGLVTIGIPESLNSIIEVKLTEVMSKPLPETTSHTFSGKALTLALKFIQEKTDGVVLGPGISVHPETAALIREMISRIGKPLVIDADGLKAIAGSLSLLEKKAGPVILTPHPGEMGVLLGKSPAEIQENRPGLAREFARRYGVMVILKGHRTVVTDGKKVFVNTTGNPGMATAGSGDVLAGILGSFLVQGMEPFQAAKTAVYLHGLAGDLAAKDKGEICLIAGDIIEFLPEAFNSFRREKRE